ncbi:MAG: oligopeptide transporter, OPT family [Thermoplasmata archaeon]|nr:oligopeptide transporter, OPT family [Thermoplasmata archaeon]
MIVLSSVEPFIPADKSIPEMTPRAILVGAILAVIMAATNAYLGLKVGMTVSATIPAAVISLAVFKAVGGTILEANLSKTMASAGESLAAGVIFTIPAFVLINAWTGIRYMETTLIALIGGVLGVLFTISLRRILVEEEGLPFPEGVASAEVLFAGWEGGASAKFVFVALIVGGVYKFLSAGLKIMHDKVEAVVGVWKAKFFFGGELSAALVSVGYIIGPRISSYVFLGGIIGWVLVLPIFLSAALAGGYPGVDPGMDPLEVVSVIRSEQIIWIGIGAIVFGGIWTMLSLRTSMKGAFGEALRGIKGIKGGEGAAEKEEVPRTERDLPVDKSLLLAAALVIPIAGLYFFLTGSGLVAGVGAIVMVVAAFFFTAIAGYLAGVVGSSNNPISGVTITTLLFASLLLLLLGVRGESGMAGALGVGAVVCSAAAIAGDVLQDFKTGQIVGSTPRSLQIGEMIGVVATAFIIAPVLMVLERAYGIGGAELQAPQAQVMASILNAFFGGTVNFTMFLAGMELAILLIIFDIPILAVAIGIYLPFTLSTPIMLGGLLHAVVDRIGRKHKGEEIATEKLHGHGILYSSGLIAGEALIGIVVAALLIANVQLKITPQPVPLLGILFFLGVVFLLYKTAVEGVGGSIGEGITASRELAVEAYRITREKMRNMLRW